MACLVGSVLAAGVACSDPTRAVAWVATGDRAAFPSPLAAEQAMALTIDAQYIYWITADDFLYRAPRTAGEVARVPLPARGALLSAHNDIFVGWTDESGNAAIADIDPESGTLKAMNQKPGALRGLVAGQHGYSFAVAAPNGTRVQTCLNDRCTELLEIDSEFKSLALDLPTRTFYVLTVDGLRACTLDGGCPTDAASTPAATSFVAALPGTYFLLDSNGQASGENGSPNFGSAAAPGPTKFVVVDGKGFVGTWSNGSELAQRLLSDETTTTELPVACTDFETDASGRPFYCLTPNSIQLIP